MRNVPLRLTFITESQCSFVRFASLASRVIPAQLTSMDATTDVEVDDEVDARVARLSALTIAFFTCNKFVTSQ